MPTGQIGTSGQEQPDMIGRKFWRWVVLKYDADTSFWKSRDYYLCRCNCDRNTEKIIEGKSLRTSNSKSCGCYMKEMASKAHRIDLMCQKFGRWRVVRELDTRMQGQIAWLCKCDCGNEQVIGSSNLRSGKTKSCGCYRDEMAGEYLRNVTGAAHPGYTDGAYTDMIKFYDEMRRRDKYTCQKCNKTQEAELKDTGKQLHIHHKDSNHYNDVPSNVQTLCQSCHRRAECEIEREAAIANELKIMCNIDEYNFDSLKDILI